MAHCREEVLRTRGIRGSGAGGEGRAVRRRAVRTPDLCVADPQLRVGEMPCQLSQALFALDVRAAWCTRGPRACRAMHSADCACTVCRRGKHGRC